MESSAAFLELPGGVTGKRIAAIGALRAREPDAPICAQAATLPAVGGMVAGGRLELRRVF
jgi:hypothetical protein